MHTLLCNLLTEDQIKAKGNSQQARTEGFCRKGPGEHVDICV